MVQEPVAWFTANSGSLTDHIVVNLAVTQRSNCFAAEE